MQCWPQTPTDPPVASPLTDSQVALLLRSTQDSDLWKETAAKISAMKSALLNLKEEYAKCSQTWFDVEHMSYLERTSQVLAKARDALGVIRGTLKVDASGADNCFSAGIAFVHRLLKSSVTNIEAFKSEHAESERTMPEASSKPEATESDISSNDLIRDTEHAVTSAMLVVQDLLKVEKHQDEDTKEESGDGEENGGELAEEEDIGLLKNLITDHLFGPLRNSATKLRLMEVSSFEY